jgi:hypothetical protein
VALADRSRRRCDRSPVVVAVCPLGLQGEGLERCSAMMVYFNNTDRKKVPCYVKRPSYSRRRRRSRSRPTQWRHAGAVMAPAVVITAIMAMPGAFITAAIIVAAMAIVETLAMGTAMILVTAVMVTAILAAALRPWGRMVNVKNYRAVPAHRNVFASPRNSQRLRPARPILRSKRVRKARVLALD